MDAQRTNTEDLMAKADALVRAKVHDPHEHVARANEVIESLQTEVERLRARNSELHDEVRHRNQEALKAWGEVRKLRAELNDVPLRNKPGSLS